MPLHRIPNVRVWLVAKDYLEAAEHLLDVNRLIPAVILAGLSNEIFLKSFLAEQDSRGFVETERGHELRYLYSRISSNDRSDLEVCSREVDDQVNFEEGLEKFDRVFTQTRYRNEKGASAVVGSDVIYFSRHLCETVFLLGVKRQI